MLTKSKLQQTLKLYDKAIENTQKLGSGFWRRLFWPLLPKPARPPDPPIIKVLREISEDTKILKEVAIDDKIVDCLSAKEHVSVSCVVINNEQHLTLEQDVVMHCFSVLQDTTAIAVEKQIKKNISELPEDLLEAPSEASSASPTLSTARVMASVPPGSRAEVSAPPSLQVKTGESKMPLANAPGAAAERTAEPVISSAYRPK